MKKILIIKIGAIGDVIMMLPLLKKIKEDHPESSIDFIAGRTVEPILSLVKEIDRLIIINDKKLLTGSSLDKTDEILSLWGKILFHKYNLVINAHSDRRYKLLQAVVLTDKYRSLDFRNRENSLVSIRYHADEYLKLYTGKDNWEMDTAVYPRLSVDQPEKIIPFSGKDTKKIVVIAPGGAKNLLNDDEVRRLPIETYVEAAKTLSEKYTIVLCGSESDNYISDFFKDVTCTNLIGKTSLRDLIYLLNHSALLITHDTGTMHLAKVTKTKLLALFGPTHPLGRIRHLEGKTSYIWKGDVLACSPCYDGKNFAECNNNICMKSITSTEIISAAKKMLDENEG